MLLLEFLGMLKTITDIDTHKNQSILEQGKKQKIP